MIEISIAIGEATYLFDPSASKAVKPAMFTTIPEAPTMANLMNVLLF
jgi:hypothetical protein